MSAIARLLVANRGEIAVRVIRAAREMGMHAVAVYSDADAGARWVRLADDARRIGPAPARQSYLDIAAIVAAAVESGCDAVHPGYGLLSESAEFAQAVLDAGLRFVGPAPAAIAAMGDKVTARHAAIASGVPVLPGSDGAIATLAQARAAAERIGFPLAVKASFGGGGRGLRVARDAGGLKAALEQARSEAGAAFGRDAVFLERYLDRPRHVEVQVLGDSHGTIIHLGDRDCTVQRRHQKLMEEAPAPDLSPELRTAMQEAALRLCRHVGYESAGTVEFLVSHNGCEYFFLEMNTRLQVEHGVTELVTGIDLVAAQLAIAGGAPLPISQREVTIRGHAIQARIAAEDVGQGFRPCPGPITRLRLPLGPWLRFDFGVDEGDVVPPHYDSMFGKVQAWGRDRDEALRRLAIALGEMEVGGVPTTAPYLARLLDEPAFAASGHDTGSVERDWIPEAAPTFVPQPPPVTGGTSARTVTVPWGGGSSVVAIHRAATADGKAASVRTRTERENAERSDTNTGGDGAVTAPMDAVVARITAFPGRQVARGDELLVLEAMKMELPIVSPRTGIVAEVRVIAGQPVRSATVLVTMEQDA